MMGSSLLLCAALPIFLSSISRSISTYWWHKKILDAVALHRPNPDDNEDDHPMLRERGMLFFGGLVRDQAWRVPLVCMERVDKDIIAKEFGMPKLVMVGREFGAIIMASTTKSKTTSKRNRGPTRDIRTFREPDERNRIDFRLVEKGVRSLPRVRPQGADVVDHFDPTDYVAEDPIDVAATQIWEQFAHDLLSVAPSKQKKPPLAPDYLVCSPEFKSGVTKDVYLTTDLVHVFSAVQYKLIDAAEWGGSLFDCFFPSRDFDWTRARQHFGRCAYYKLYVDFASRVSPSSLSKARNAFRLDFMTFKWLPYANKSKMWPTTVEAGGRSWTRVPENPGKPAPAIGVNRSMLHNHRCVVSVRGEGVVTEGEEEEITDLIDHH
jgi:hypothetical protein